MFGPTSRRFGTREK
ncbi:hypothetical protein LINGRAHAP2_LOCUS13702 [Linum grandiflorum]